jgi:hypothetical protein
MLRSTIQCATMCTSTQGCSAYQFHKDSGMCYLGSKFDLLMNQPSDNKVTNITINTDGMHYILLKCDTRI